VKELKYLGTNLTNQNSNQEEINSRMLNIIGAEYFVLQFAIQKFKDEDIQN